MGLAKAGMGLEIEIDLIEAVYVDIERGIR